MLIRITFFSNANSVVLAHRGLALTTGAGITREMINQIANILR